MTDGIEKKRVGRPELPSADAGSPPALAHTPGPWTAHQGWADAYLNNDAGKHPNWCEVVGPEDGPYLSICGHFGIANARLIAAAPDLLDALRELVAAFGDITIVIDGVEQPETDPVVIAARAAIAKATAQ